MFNIWLRTLQLSVKSLWMHPLRSSLTVLGIFIGVSSVIWLLAIGQGIGRAAQEQIASLGRSTSWSAPSSPRATSCRTPATG